MFKISIMFLHDTFLLRFVFQFTILSSVCNHLDLLVIFGKRFALLLGKIPCKEERQETNRGNSWKIGALGRSLLKAVHALSTIKSLTAKAVLGYHFYI